MAHVQIAGAGLAGLACALRLSGAGVEVTVHEAARHAGGRCRSFHEKSLDTVIDNGNHLVMSGNTAAMAFLRDIGAEDRLAGTGGARFPFLDLDTGERWCVTPSRGRLPFWVFDKSRRVAGTGPADYLSVVRMLKRHRGAAFTDIVPPTGALFERFWDPFIVAVLNTQPARAAAELVTPVLWETFGKGADACRPLVARDGLSDTFVDPALASLAERGVEVRFGRRVSKLDLGGSRVAAMRSGDDVVELSAEDILVLGLPAPVTADLVPGLETPGEHSPIVNLHYKIENAAGPLMDAPFLGLTNGLAQWLFVRDDIASVTISGADDVVDWPADRIASRVWRDVANALGTPNDPQPPCRVIKERRATFLQSPDQVALRPPAQTAYANLLLAGDWTDTGIPATIEGAIRSGFTAADAALTNIGARG